MLRKLRGVALITGALVAVVALVSAWFWPLHPPASTQTSLTPAEVRQIVKVVSKKRWELMLFAIRKRDFKLLRHFAFVRIESVNADSAASEKATVLCRVAFESGFRVIMTLEREGTNGWRFVRWFVTEEPRKPAPQPILPGKPGVAGANHNWTVHVGDSYYGLSSYPAKTLPGFRIPNETRFHFGRHSFSLFVPFHWVIGIAFGLLGSLAAASTILWNREVTSPNHLPQAPRASRPRGPGRCDKRDETEKPIDHGLHGLRG